MGLKYTETPSKTTPRRVEMPLKSMNQIMAGGIKYN